MNEFVTVGSRRPATATFNRLDLLRPISGGRLAGPAAPVAPVAAGPAAPSTQLPGPLPRSEPLSEGRRAEIGRWFQENRNAESGWGPFRDSIAGDRIGAALRGIGELGRLTAAERDHLAGLATAHFAEGNRTEALRETARAVADDPAAAAALARAYAAPAAADQALYAAGGATLNSPEGAAARHDLLRAAVALDPAAATAAFAGHEDALARLAHAGMGRDATRGLMQAVADRRIPAEAADRLVSAAFVHATGDDLRDDGLRSAMAEALAMIRRPGTAPADQAARDAMARRLAAVLDSAGGRDLLFGDSVRPEHRAWAFARVMDTPGWTAETLREGWESDIVSTAFAADASAAFAVIPAGQMLSGNALRNTVGQAMGAAPDLLPAETETAAGRQARLAAGLDHAYYSETSTAGRIAARIAEVGGPGARVSVVPVALTSNDFGAATVPVFRLDRADGTTGFVDTEGHSYRDFDHWRRANTLPPGRMTSASGLRPGAAMAAPENTPGVTDSLGEWAGRIGDHVALGAGIVAAGALIVGTAGTGALLLAGGAGVWTAGRAGAELAAEADRGGDITDFSNPAIRSRWLDLAAGTLSLGAIGAGVKIANSARAGVGASQTLMQAGRGLAIAADVVDATQATDLALQLGQNWDRLSNADRAAGVLSVAFWAGMTGASMRAGQIAGNPNNGFDRVQNLLETGTPFPLRENAALAPGEMRVVYDTAPNGPRANAVRIEHGPGAVDPAMLDLHTVTAHQIEAAGGLSDQLGRLLGGRTPEVGSAAWEARLEIDKIGREARGLARELTDPALPPARRGELETRQRELDQALGRESERLAAASMEGNGWIAAPSRGSQQARALGWADAPDGYAWVAGDGGRPVLYQADGSLPVNEFDPVRGQFTERFRRGESGRLNPYLNPPRNDVAQPLAPNLRIEYDNGQVFETNAQGHVSRAEANLTIDPWVRDGRSQAAYGNLGTPARDFDGGHLLARLFGGAPDRINVVPMDSTLNQRGLWRQTEQDWEQMLQNGQDVRVEIDVIYPDGGGPVPERFQIVETIDGVPSEPRTLWNTPDGQPAS